jgi:glycosyltransferase involved in cell wall biosynthesis
MCSEPTLFVVNSLSGGGAENSISVLTSRLKLRGWNVFLLAMNQTPGISVREKKNHEFELERRWGGGIKETLGSYKSFRNYCKSLNVHTVVANCELPELVVALSPLSVRKIIAVEHTSKPWEKRRALGFIVRRILRFRGVNWVTVSTSSNSIWQCASTPICIANPVIPNEFALSREGRQTEIVFVGRMRSEKRPEWVIEAAIESGLRLDIFGDGLLKESLQEKYLKHNLKIEFHGYVSNPWESISTPSLVVVPSVYEGDGMVVVEAILAGHEILLADNEDLRRFSLPSGNYFKSEEDLSRKVSNWKAMGRGTYAISSEYKENLRQTRDIEHILDQWQRILE